MYVLFQMIKANNIVYVCTLTRPPTVFRYGGHSQDGIAQRPEIQIP